MFDEFRLSVVENVLSSVSRPVLELIEFRISRRRRAASSKSFWACSNGICVLFFMSSAIIVMMVVSDLNPSDSSPCIRALLVFISDLRLSSLASNLRMAFGSLVAARGMSDESLVALMAVNPGVSFLNLYV